MNRKQRRKQARENKKTKNKDVSEKLGLFEKIPKNCLTCDKKFDKLNKEMVMSWNVIVREKQGIVRLYCPDCWNKATQFAKEVRDYGEKND
tara:strand:+ start:159 stop:431 length:273 start_codon:yes stop_codon:yes gene_type:complete